MIKILWWKFNQWLDKIKKEYGDYQFQTELKKQNLPFVSKTGKTFRFDYMFEMLTKSFPIETPRKTEKKNREKSKVKKVSVK